MLNRIRAALAAAMLFAAVPAFAAGTLPLALAQQIDINGIPLAGCQVNFFVAGTVATPQNAYSDVGLTQSLGPQLSCDQAGRVPMFWLADGLVHVRLIDAAGGPAIDTVMPVVGIVSSSGGGGGTVDPSALLATGDMVFKYGTGPRTGFVRANGLSIGNAVSGATERANADTQALFVYFYGADPNLAVSGGRTGNALADFNANKTMATPDCRGRAMAGLDDMGNTAAGRLTATYFGTTATVLGAAAGNEANSLVSLNLPPYTPAGAVGVSVLTPNVLSGGTSDNYTSVAGAGTYNNPTRGTLSATGTFTGTAQGGTSAPFRTTPPLMVGGIYVKL